MPWTKDCDSFWTYAISACLIITSIFGAVAGSPKTLPENEYWWSSGHTTIDIWDQSWLTPRLVCGLRFFRLPIEEAANLLWLSPDASFDRSKESGNGINSGKSKHPQLAGLEWVFDGTTFQTRALEFYDDQGPPPMNDVWLLVLLSTIPGSPARRILSTVELLELKCTAVFSLAQYIYAEYLTYLVPPAVLLKYFEHSWEVHAREGLAESASELAEKLKGCQPQLTASESFAAALKTRQEVINCWQSGLDSSACANVVVQPLVDVVIARCREDLNWVRTWLARILRDEWTPEVPGLRLRLLIFERCETPGSAAHSDKLTQTLIADLKRLSVITAGSAIIDLVEPPGFENVPYIYYCRNKNWHNADFTFFLHGSPFDHLDVQTLDDVLRSLAQGTYNVPFLHLNTKRTPLVATENCIKDLLQPALAAWEEETNPKRLNLPPEFSTYCCSQFVVSHDRIQRVPDAFWEVVWLALQRHDDNDELSRTWLPNSCANAAKRIYESHHRHGHSMAADHGLWAVVLERVWHWIFGEAAKLPIRDRDRRLPLFLRVPRSRASVDGGPRGTLHDRVSQPDWGFNPGWWGMPEVLSNVTAMNTVAEVVPVPTRYFTRPARKLWKLPEWVRAWFEEEGL